MDDEATEAEIAALENERNDVLFCAKSELCEWSSRAISKPGPPSGQSTTVMYTYEFLDVQPWHDSQDAGTSLRGALKDIFAELGGGEVCLHADRNAFRSDRYHEWTSTGTLGR